LLQITRETLEHRGVDEDGVLGVRRLKVDEILCVLPGLRGHRGGGRCERGVNDAYGKGLTEFRSLQHGGGGADQLGKPGCSRAPATVLHTLEIFNLGDRLFADHPHAGEGHRVQDGDALRVQALVKKRL
jgi:hypothetical protein